MKKQKIYKIQKGHNMRKKGKNELIDFDDNCNFDYSMYSDVFNNKRQKIKICLSKIAYNLQEMQDLQYDLDNAKTDKSYYFTLGIFGKSKKDKEHDIFKKMISVQQQIIIQQQIQIQEILKLTSWSIVNNFYMYKQLNDIMEGKFKDIDGNIIRLNMQQRAIIQEIISNGGVKLKLFNVIRYTICKPIGFVKQKLLGR